MPLRRVNFPRGVVLRIASVCCLVMAAACFAYVTYVHNDYNWRPAELPLPGPGLEVRELFEIPTAGEFELEVSVPSAAAGERATAGPAPCKFVVALDGPRGRHEVQSISSFHRGGNYRFGRVDLYFSDLRLSLEPGEYTLRITNEGTTPAFGDRGALVSFTRFVHPAEWVLLGSLLRGAGWVSLLLGLVVFVVSEAYARKLHRREPDAA